MLTPCEMCSWSYVDEYGEWDGCILNYRDYGIGCDDFEAKDGGVASGGYACPRLNEAKELLDAS